MFSCNGLFHEEPAFVLKDDLEGSAQATSVLSLVGQGVSRPSEMAARLQVPQTALSRPLARLTGLGLVAREVPFGVDAKGGKRSLYRLCDPFLRFWYTFALPHYSDPHFGEEKSDIKSLRHPFRVFLGQAWETLVRDSLQHKALPNEHFRWSNAARWWGVGLDGKPMEIDVVAESPDGDALLVGEAKLALSKSEAKREMSELARKATMLPFASRYKRVETSLFVAEGGDFDCVDLSWNEER